MAWVHNPPGGVRAPRAGGWSSPHHVTLDHRRSISSRRSIVPSQALPECSSEEKCQYEHALTIGRRNGDSALAPVVSRDRNCRPWSAPPIAPIDRHGRSRIAKERNVHV